MKIKRGKPKKKVKKQEITISEHTDIKQSLNIYAMDVASHLGWAKSRKVYGVWDLSTRKDESHGMKLLRLESKLNDLYNLDKPELIVYERVAGHHKAALIHEAKLVGFIEAWCEKMKIEYKAYSANEIKKFATGKGNAGKPMMIAAAKAKLDYPGNDDNEADALWLLELAKQDLGIK